MAKCKKIVRTDKRVCVGSLNRKIELLTRSLAAPKLGVTGFEEEFTLFKSVWSMIQTSRGSVIFDDSNIERELTHKIYIRYIEDLTAEIWVRLPSITEGKDNLLDVLRIENLEEENRFLLLSCTIRGDDTKKANEA